MSLYVLDTDIVVLYRAGNAAVIARILCTPPDEMATTVITVEEQLSGWYTMVRQAKGSTPLAHAYQRLADSVKTLSQFRILSFTEPAIDQFHQLRKLKLGVKHTDLRIAAIALTHGGVLVTRNIRDFVSIPNLIIQDWSK